VASPHFEANIASLRNEVEQHHFERSEKHHIAVRRRQMNEVALRANDVLRNDVGFAQ